MQLQYVVLADIYSGATDELSLHFKEKGKLLFNERSLYVSFNYWLKPSCLLIMLDVGLSYPIRSVSSIPDTYTKTWIKTSQIYGT